MCEVGCNVFVNSGTRSWRLGKRQAWLVRRGWSDENLARLSRGNLLRAFSKAEEVAAELQKVRSPSLKTIEELDGLSGS